MATRPHGDFCNAVNRAFACEPISQRRRDPVDKGSAPSKQFPRATISANCATAAQKSSIFHSFDLEFGKGVKVELAAAVSGAKAGRWRLRHRGLSSVTWQRNKRHIGDQVEIQRDAANAPSQSPTRSRLSRRSLYRQRGRRTTTWSAEAMLSLRSISRQARIMQSR